MMPIAESGFPKYVRLVVEDEETNNSMLDIFRNTLNQSNSIPRKNVINEPILYLTNIHYLINS